MQSRALSNLLAVLGSYSLVTFLALARVHARVASAAGSGSREIALEAFPFRLGFPQWALLLTALAALSFAIGLAPLLFFRGRFAWPLLAGAAAGLFWLALAWAGAPYSLGLTAPAGLAIVSVFLGVLISAASLARSFVQQDRPGD